MTGAYTDEKHYDKNAIVILFPVSRLVVDVERFEKEDHEPTSRVGMDEVSSMASQGKLLRRVLSEQEVKDLVGTYYQPHHGALQSVIYDDLKRKGMELIVDCQSYSSRPLFCDLDQHEFRSDFCAGSDPFHTPDVLLDWLTMAKIRWCHPL